MSSARLCPGAADEVESEAVVVTDGVLENNKQKKRAGGIYTGAPRSVIPRGLAGGRVPLKATELALYIY
jgi:hypothetical protein